MEVDSRKKELDQKDKFVAMATAKADVDLKLSEFKPVSMLVTPVHAINRSSVPAIDYHNHLDAFEPREVLKVMDACGIERVVNITMKTGDEALESIDRYAAIPERFSTIGWMDWSGVERPDFVQKSLDTFERLRERGICGMKFWKDLGLSVRDASGEVLRIDDERLAPLFDKAAELGMPVMFHTAAPDAFFLPIDAKNERYEELAAHPDWGFTGSRYSKDELMEQRNRVFARHPKTTFVGSACWWALREPCARLGNTRQASKRFHGHERACGGVRSAAVHCARIFSALCRSHSVWHGPVSGDRHI